MLELALLEALIANQESSTEVIWSLNGPMMSVLLDRTEVGDGGRIRKALGALRGFQNALRTLVQSVDDGISHVEGQSKAILMSTGICGLPDDILYLLFDYARLEQHHSFCRKARSVPVEITLSHVCRQFRCKILQSPTMWSFIYSWYPRNMLNAYYLRSKYAGLIVRLSLSDLDFPYSWLYGMSNRHIERWKELSLDSDAEFWSDKEFGVLQKLGSWLSSCTFSHLQTLSIKCPVGSYDSYTEEKFRSPFFEHWRMPVLRELRLCNILPGKVNLHTKLTSFQLTINNHSMLTQRNNVCITSFLQSLPSLSHLTLSIPSDFPESDSQPLGPIVLPHLRSLRLENRFEGSKAPFQNALTRIHAPMLSNLHLEATFSDHCMPNDYARWMAHVCPSLVNFPSVANLALFINVASGKDKGEVVFVECLSHIFSSLPGLRGVHFGCRASYEMQVLDKDVSSGSPAFVGVDWPSITRLCWHNCSINDTYLSAILQGLASRPSWSAFEALEYVEGNKVHCLPKSIIGRLLARRIPISWKIMAKTQPFS